MRPHPRYAETDPSFPSGWGTCERCGFVWNLRRLDWQFEFRGTRLDNTRHLVCPHCLDEPQRQLGTIFIPPDPLPLLNARPENYTIDEQTFRVTQLGQQRYTMDGTPRIESNVQSGSGYSQGLATDKPGMLVITTDGGQQIIFNP